MYGLGGFARSGPREPPEVSRRGEGARLSCKPLLVCCCWLLTLCCLWPVDDCRNDVCELRSGDGEGCRGFCAGELFRKPCAGEIGAPVVWVTCGPTAPPRRAVGTGDMRRALDEPAEVLQNEASAADCAVPSVTAAGVLTVLLMR